MKKSSIQRVNGVDYATSDLQAMGTLAAILDNAFNNEFWEKGSLKANGADDSYRAGCRIRFKMFLRLDSGMLIESLDTTNAQIKVFTDNGNGTISESSWITTATINPNSIVRVEIDGAMSSATETTMSIAEILAKVKITPVRGLFGGFDKNVTNGQLEVMGITAVYQFPRNRAYFLNNVTGLSGMPEELESPYNGCMMCFESSKIGWPVYIYVTNMGNVYVGTSSGSSMRWGEQYRDLNQQLAGIYGKKVVLVGDSIMYGSHMSDAGEGSRTVITIRGTTVKNNTSTKVWSYLFANYLTSQYGCTVLNQSFPGCSFNDVTNNLSTLIPNDNNYAIILLGVNDWGNPSSVRTHMATIKTYCKNNGITPVFITPYPGKEYVAELAQIRGCMKESRKEVADFYSEFNNMLYVMGVDIDDLFDDTVHYNDAGQPYIFEAVKKCLML